MKCGVLRPLCRVTSIQSPAILQRHQLNALLAPSLHSRDPNSARQSRACPPTVSSPPRRLTLSLSGTPPHVSFCSSHTFQPLLTFHNRPLPLLLPQEVKPLRNPRTTSPLHRPVELRRPHLPPSSSPLPSQNRRTTMGSTLRVSFLRPPRYLCLSHHVRVTGIETNTDPSVSFRSRASQSCL